MKRLICSATSAGGGDWRAGGPVKGRAPLLHSVGDEGGRLVLSPSGRLFGQRSQDDRLKKQAQNAETSRALAPLRIEASVVKIEIVAARDRLVFRCFHEQLACPRRRWAVTFVTRPAGAAAIVVITASAAIKMNRRRFLTNSLVASAAGPLSLTVAKSEHSDRCAAGACGTCARHRHIAC